MSSIQWGFAKLGSSGLWFKPGKGADGKLHLLVAEKRAGVDGGSHDHYWKNSNGTFGVQLKDKSGFATVQDGKGHIFPVNSTFPQNVNSSLEKLFKEYCK